ncbi:only proline and serine are matching in the corresponding protein [Sarocladium implicatum]|nr:only proline and serine are matching in the corresponding protein [Sarocladium implicatum]
MSPKLKPLLLPQIVENRSYPKNHEHHASLTKSVCEGDLTHVYSSATTNSSSSDIASPLTPTFSARHMRYSSSTSSLELPAHLQETPSSPIYQQQASKPQPQQLQYLSQLPQSAVKPAKRSLPDVEEEPFERAEAHEYAPTSHFGLYSCLCDRPCEHRTSTGSIFPGDFVTEGEIDYDAGFMSDSDIGSEARWSGRQRTNSDAPFHGLTTRIGSHFSNNINRWRSTRRPNLISSPTTEVSFETAMPYGHSSRSSSISASANARGRSFDGSAANTPQPISYFPSPEVMERQSSEGADLTTEERMNLERDRAMATTPLLPPLLTKLPSERLQESPLQSPAVASPATNTEVQTSPTVSTYVPRPSLSSKPSFSSFRFGGSGTDLPLPLPAMVQDHDEWSDRLGHANFTITPQPYEPEIIAPETLTRFREDWELAKVNYTKHLVRTGENYGQTSNIYALTEAKWAETEDRWRSIHEGLIRQTMVFHSAPVSASNSRSRSRGRARGRSRAGSATFIRGRAAASADVSPDMHHWPRLDAAAPNAITQMLDASDKFPNRGDEDIVGPMVRDEVMLRTHSEERKTSRFWKTLVEKVGIKK